MKKLTYTLFEDQGRILQRGTTTIKRRLLLSAAALTAILLLSAHLSARKPPSSPLTPEQMREHALALNELAGNIHSLDDAHQLVDRITEIFANDLSPAWTIGSFRDRLAAAEYAAATNPADLIPEQRLANAWNIYAQTINAAPETLVTAAEIHNLRDAQYATARSFWTRNYQQIWTVPNIYALRPDGKVANGCRAIETIRIFWDLANHFEKLQSARDRVGKGILASDLFAHADEHRTSGSMGSGGGRVSAGIVRPDPVVYAERQYASQHGETALIEAAATMLNTVFPSTTRLGRK